MIKGKYHAEYIEHMKCYRLYDPRYPEQTVAYIDNPEEEKEHNVKIIIIE
jgi:hypothetical protein